MIDYDFQFWLVVWGFVIAFILAFGIGANDVANSFGTSVGSKVITLKQACILATIFEIMGSVLIGAKVSGTIRKGILDPLEFADDPTILMFGYVSSLVGCCIWLILATILNLPVSGTHSIVGAVLGMAIVTKPFTVIKWGKIATIVLSWFISPLISGVVSLIFFVLIRRFILRAASPLKAGLKYLPMIYTLTICVNIGGILESSPPMIGLHKVPWWAKLIILLVLAVGVYLTVWLILVPKMKKKIEQTMISNKTLELEEKSFNVSVETEKCKKINISTQIDYIELIISKNIEQLKLKEKIEEEEKLFRKKEFDDYEKSKNEQMSQVPYINSLTVHGYKNLDAKNRIRLISAPTNPDNPFDLDDVNLTLRGYLHSINHSSKSNSKPILKTNKTEEGALNKLGENKEQLQKPIETQTENLANSAPKPTTKRGRFSLVPAKFQADENEIKTNLVLSEKSSAKISLLDLDTEVEENICELRQNKKNVKDDLDEFSHSDPPEAAKLFSFLQILTAVFGSFSHGGNDVSNAIGPLIGLFLIFKENKIESTSPTPEWILFYGGVGISVGLWILGRRVIKTIGEDLTKITPSSGFVIEIASAMTVLVATLTSIPVSTTHCKVGSVVFTGRVRSKQSVDWSLFRNIIIAWIVTVPLTAGIAAICQYCLVFIIFKK